MASDRPKLSIEQLYSAALSLTEEQRAQYLAAHCSDTVVREDLLRKLSDATRTVTSFGEPARRSPPALSAGMHLHHYRIQKALGSGGMGYVYEAVDETLNRPVALKVLPAGRYDEASRIRFRREAEAASALNHPNIVTVYEVNREGEIDFIAMERISGQTLESMIAARPMPIRQVLQIAAQIADALAVAHEAGIVHRDLKPSNVMVNDRGIVKVLDFGLAKQVLERAAVSGETGDPLSVRGEVLGTAAYMSPEQAEGKPVDSRSDIFAFGTVLYEMLTGRMPFLRDTAMATLISITTVEPESLRNVRPDVPRLLESVFKRCVRKQPHERWQDLADVKVILQELAADLESDSGSEDAVTQAKPNRRWIWYAAGIAVAAALLTLGMQRAMRSPAAPPLSTLRLVTAERGLSTSPVLSPDGALLAFASDRANQGNLDIWIQQVGGSEPLRLTSDPSDESDPSFSPDGARIAFRSEKDGGGIYIVPTLGGDPVLVAPKGRNPRFSPDGKSLAYWVGREGSMVPGASKPYIVDFATGVARAVETGLTWAQYPVWSPDSGSLILYGMSASQAGISGLDWWIVPAAGGQAQRVRMRETLQSMRLRFSMVLDWSAGEDGPQILFAPDANDNSNLWRMGLRPDGKVEGPPVRVTNGPGRQIRASFVEKKDGTARLAFADQTVNNDVWQLPVSSSTGLPSSSLERLTDRVTPDLYPSVSGDGRQAYYITVRLGTWSLVRKDLDTNRERVLYTATDTLYNSRVAPYGSKLFFSSRPAELLAIPTAGGAIEKLCPKCGSVTGSSAQGDRLLFEPSEDEHLMMLDLTSGKTIKLADRGSAKTLLDAGQFSPDGKWVAFQATDTETQTSAVYVIPIAGQLPVPRNQWIAITDSAELSRDATWAPTGSLLYFTSERDGSRCIWARKLNPVTKTPEGDAFPVQHFHTTRLGLRYRSSAGNMISLSAGGGRLVFALTETTGNIWLEETRSAR